MTKGIFITVDGPDGAGKTTMITGIESKLLNMGYQIHITKEPSFGPIGTLIKSNRFEGTVLACLVAADRLYHLKNEICPAIDDGKIVICDKYIASGFVYQTLDKVSLDVIKQLNSEILIPDISIFVFADSSVIYERLSERTFLSRMERTVSPQKMKSSYKEAALLCKRLGYKNIIELTNNNDKDLEYNIQTVVNKIITMEQEVND